MLILGHIRLGKARVTRAPHVKYPVIIGPLDSSLKLKIMGAEGGFR